MGVKPTYRVLANGSDITAMILDRFESLSMSDETGVTSDLLEIVLADYPTPIQKPPKGAELELFLGYDGINERMGMFICDEIEYTGWPSEMIIRARGAVFDKTPKGKANLQSQKERSWPSGTKLGDMVAKIAKEHGMEYAVSASLKSVVLPHIDQASESDLNLLVRIGKKYDAIVKPADGKLVLAKRGESKSVSGKSMAAIHLTPASDISAFRVTETSRESSGTVVAYYRDNANSKRHELKVGEGEPVTRVKRYFPNQDMAKSAAQAELAKRDRQKSTLSLRMPGRNDLAAECPLTLAGFRDGVDGAYIITRVRHDITKGGGYACDVEAELPNDGEAKPGSGNAAPKAKPITDTPDGPVEPPKTRTRATVQAELDKLNAEWSAEIDKSSAIMAEAVRLGETGDLAGKQAKLAEGQAVLSAAEAKYQPGYNRLKAELATLP